MYCEDFYTHWRILLNTHQEVVSQASPLQSGLALVISLSPTECTEVMTQLLKVCEKRLGSLCPSYSLVTLTFGALSCCEAAMLWGSPGHIQVMQLIASGRFQATALCESLWPLATESQSPFCFLPLSLLSSAPRHWGPETSHSHHCTVPEFLTHSISEHNKMVVLLTLSFWVIYYTAAGIGTFFFSLLLWTFKWGAKRKNSFLVYFIFIWGQLMPKYCTWFQKRNEIKLGSEF